jgi:hypothetical protein
MTEKLFDIVIPVGPNDIEHIYKQIEYTKKNIIGYRNIYIIAYRTDFDISGCTIINESIFPFTLDSVAAIHGKHKRNGWYLQQLLKLYAGFVIPDVLDRYLVIDSDTFFLKPTHFMDKEGRCLMNPGREYHMEYFDHMKKLHPELKRVHPQLSGISHHMIFDRNYVRKLMDFVEANHEGKEFWKIFLEKVTNIGGSGASEYEIYFNFMLTFHSDKIRIRPLVWTNTPKFIEDKRFDYISWHWHMRT